MIIACALLLRHSITAVSIIVRPSVLPVCFTCLSHSSISGVSFLISSSHLILCWPAFLSNSIMLIVMFFPRSDVGTTWPYQIGIWGRLDPLIGIGLICMSSIIALRIMLSMHSRSSLSCLHVLESVSDTAGVAIKRPLNRITPSLLQYNLPPTLQHHAHVSNKIKHDTH